MSASHQAMRSEWGRLPAARGDRRRRSKWRRPAPRRSGGPNSIAWCASAVQAKRLERETGFEPATSTLARSHSTTELFPPSARSPSVHKERADSQTSLVYTERSASAARVQPARSGSRWRRRQAVRQRSAKPPSPVRFRAAPPVFPRKNFRIDRSLSSQRGTWSCCWSRCGLYSLDAEIHDLDRLSSGQTRGGLAAPQT